MYHHEKHACESAIYLLQQRETETCAGVKWACIVVASVGQQLQLLLLLPGSADGRFVLPAQPAGRVTSCELIEPSRLEEGVYRPHCASQPTRRPRLPTEPR